MPHEPSDASAPLRSTLEGDPDMAELVGLFVGDLPQRIDSLRTAWSEHRAADLQRLAHQLRGSSASYGFASIGDSAGRLEDALRDLDLARSPTLDAFKSSVDELIELCRRAAVK
ncbi:MAG: hypothetical protein HBSAPP03_27950 [Phycisphaerae bacterium]|nr:MAG: hypothetical protein HBSAPP03_27950 [Phycisphaerae bacterium]